MGSQEDKYTWEKYLQLEQHFQLHAHPSDGETCQFLVDRLGLTLEKDLFELILTCEERVYHQVIDLSSREQETCQPVHVVNVDIQDNHEEATLGAFLICELCQCIQHTEDTENEIDELLQEFEKSAWAFLHTVGFY